ncbi:MAG TPA: hypothetical protein VFW00_14600 [Rhodocyclaceae bacterium]|nr:hypothetical protein [Rhodocyclaceae bacterium]
MSTTLLWQIGFATLSGSLALVPLLPTLKTWQRTKATSTQPGGSDGYGEEWLAPVDRLRSSIQIEFATLLQLARENVSTDETGNDAHGATRGADENGVPFIVLGPKDHLVEHIPATARRLRQMVLSVRHLDIPGELVCERPLYAEGRINIAHDAAIDTALAGREIVVGIRARVKRWAHADQRLDAAEGAVLFGCVSAGREISLARRARFERLYAPRILFGRQQAASPQMPVERLPYDPPPHAAVVDDRWIVSGDLHIPAGHELTANLLVSGHLMIDRGSRVHGSVNVERTVVLAEGARVHGAIYAASSVHIGERCQVTGPLVTLGSLRADAFSELGQPEHPITVSARKIRVAESCIAHGALWARRIGEVVADA